MQWVGVPIIITTNNLHKYMKQHAFTKPAYTNEAEKEIIEQDENDRLAINEDILCVNQLVIDCQKAIYINLFII